MSVLRLVSKSRRRYGGYLVHVGIAVMFLGFTGKAWETQTETTLAPGESVTLGDYQLIYKGVRTELDHEKRMVFADLDVMHHGEPVGTLAPAKYIYMATGTQPRTVVDKHVTLRDDLYVSVGAVSPQTKMASLRVHVNTLVFFVWFGFGILLLGAGVAMWPETSFQEAGAFAYVRALGTVATMVMLSLLLALYPSKAFGQQHEMRREGVVEQSPTERALFKQLLCDCGGCAHEPLETCTCPWAHEAREWARGQLASGKSSESIVAEFASLHGSDSVIVQANTGMNRVLWAVPLALAVAVGGFMVHRVRRWSRRGREGDAAGNAQGKKGAKDAKDAKRDEYDEKLDAELRAIENEDV
jgi:cytochrome c-type biogenesis protein CcmF